MKHMALAAARYGRSGSYKAQAGLTLIELMVSMALGLLVVLVSTALLVSSKSSYVAQDDDTYVQDTGRYALEIISRAIRQAGYENWGVSGTAPTATSILSAGIFGWDDTSLKATSVALDSPLDAVAHGSDVLAVRYFGSGQGKGGDGTVLNCAGFGVAAAAHSGAEDERGWSIFYVAIGSTGEPELYCKYHGKENWNAQAIARGVESFQVLYGLDTNADSVPNQFLSATAINKLDEALVPEGATEIEKKDDMNRKTYWKKVVVVKVGILVRGTRNTRTNLPDVRYDLFGDGYGNSHAEVDKGVRVDTADLATAIRNRTRQMFFTTIQLRNQVGKSET